MSRDREARRTQRLRPTGRPTLAIGLALLTLLFVPATPTTGLALAAQEFIYEAMSARATARDWMTEVPGMTAEVAAALSAYETNPSMNGAIEVLKHYKTFSADGPMREAALNLDPVLFLNVDAAKYELVMQTQQSIHEGGNRIGHAQRVGSTGERHQLWVEWVTVHNRDPAMMPALDPAKQFSSDDDITNLPHPSEHTFTKAEGMNGDDAAEAFMAVTRDKYGNQMHPETAMIEFLSPTEAYSVLANQGITEEGKPPIAPTFLHEWVASNPEKYNGLFATEQLERWAWEKGYVTTDVSNPMGTTSPYKDVFVNSDGENAAPPPHNVADLFGWMSNQSRQALETHKGETKYIRKYTERMIRAWQKVLDETPSAGGDTEELGAFRRMLAPYDVPTGDELSKMLEGHTESSLQTLHRDLLIASHDWHTELLIERVKSHIQANTAVDAAGNRQITMSFQAMVDSDTDLKQAVGGLAVAYSNLDRETRNGLDRRLQEKVAQAGGGEPDEAYAADVAKYLAEARTKSNQAAVTALQQTRALRGLRSGELLGQELDNHLRAVQGANLDRYLLDVATGRFERTEFVWDDQTFGFVRRQLRPADVAQELTHIQDISRALGWTDHEFADEVKGYFESEPSDAVQIVKLIHEISDPNRVRPMRIEYEDADGNVHVRVIRPTRVGQGISLGLVAFKAAIKSTVQGGQAVKKIYGQYNDGRQLYQNMKAIYLGTTVSAEERAKAHAQVLASTIGLADLGEWFGYRTPGVLGSFGGTLGAAASLSAGSFMDPGAGDQLLIAFATDMVGIYAPQVAAGIFVVQTVNSGWKTWSLFSAKSDVIDLLMENGVWEIDPEGVRTPTLTGFVWYDGGSPPRVDTNLNRLAKLMPAPFANGITLRKSRRLVNPRDALKRIGYDDGYFGRDHVLLASETAAQSVVGLQGAYQFFNSVPTRSWTAETVRDAYELAIGSREDARSVPRNVPVNVLVADGAVFGFGGSNWGPHVKHQSKQTLGYFIAHYWARRQILMEDVVLKKLIEEAARRKLREVLAQRDPSTYPDEIEKLDERMKDLDRKVWGDVARGADPFDGPGYNPSTDVPITVRYVQETETFRANIGYIVEWLSADVPDPNGPRQISNETGPNMDVGLAPPVSPYVPLPADEVDQRARELLGSMLEILLQTEQEYERVLTLAQGTLKSTGQGGLDIYEFHVGLTGNRRTDPEVATVWDAGYREEVETVGRDVGRRLAESGMELAQVDNTSVFEQIQTAVFGRGNEWADMARSHPYFQYMVRLRRQIHKLTIMQGLVTGMPTGELSKATGSMVSFNELVDASAGDEGELASELERLVAVMELEYDQLLDELLDLVVPSLTLAATPPVDLLDDVVGGVSLALATDRPFVQGQRAEDLVERIRWSLFDPNGSLSARDMGPDTEWSAYPLASGPTVIRVEALGPGDMVFGTASDTFAVAQAEFRGTIEVVGDLPSDAQLELRLDPDYEWSYAAPGPFSQTIERIPADYPARLGLSTAGPPGNRPRAQVDFLMPEYLDGSPLIPVTGSPGLIEADDLLTLNLGAGVLVTVEVQDAATYPVRNADVTATGGGGSATSTAADRRPLILPLNPGDAVQATARRDAPAPQVSGASAEVAYDGAGPVGPTLTVQLPFFDTDHLLVSGKFVPAEQQDLKIIGGELSGNAIGLAGVRDGGDFEFRNDRPLLVSTGVELEAVIAVEDDWLNRVLTPVRSDLVPGTEEKMGRFEVRRYDVFVDPVPVTVVDWTGAPIPSDQVDVAVAGEAAGPSGDAFAGVATFRKKGEQVEITASMPLPDGVPADDAAFLSVDEVGDHENPQVTTPIELQLPVYQAGVVTFTGSVATADLPENVLVPDRAELAVAGAQATAVDVGISFSLSSSTPVGVNREVTATVTAESGGVRLLGEATATVTGASTTVDFGTIVMRPATAAADEEEPGDEVEPGDGTGGAGGTGAGGGSGPGADELAPLVSGWEARREEAKVACDYVGAAAAQAKVVEVAEAWVAGTFPGGAPADIQALIAQLRAEAATLEQAARAQTQAELFMATAEAQSSAGQVDEALTTLEEASAQGSLPLCTHNAIAGLHDALVDEVTRLVEDARLAAAACDYIHAAELGQQVRARAQDIEWVRTDLPGIEEMADDQEAAQTLYAEAVKLKAEGNNDAARAMAEQALTDAPECDRVAIGGFLDGLPGATRPGAGRGGTTATNVPITRTVLLLIDTSGSMNDNGKIGAAKSAASQTVRSLGPNIEVGLMTYSGGCRGGWRVVHDFTQERTSILGAIAGLSAGNGTPMSPAVIAATRYMEERGHSQSGQMLVLSDGQDSCTEVGAAAAGDAVRRSSMNIKLDGVGLDLAEGGQAETDLADLVGAAGTGRTYSASAGAAGELIRAFRRAFIADQVKMPDPVIDGPGGVRLAELYEAALQHLKNDDVRSARLAFEQATRQEPAAASAHYNLSLVYEAEGQTLSAIGSAKRYLQLAPNAGDANAVRERIGILEEEQRENPTAIFNPNQCLNLVSWGRTEAGRVGDSDQRALAYSVMVSAQRGDCGAAQETYGLYMQRYGG